MIASEVPAGHVLARVKFQEDGPYGWVFLKWEQGSEKLTTYVITGPMTVWSEEIRQIRQSCLRRGVKEVVVARQRGRFD